MTKRYNARWRMEYNRKRDEASKAGHKPGVELPVRNRHDKPIISLEGGRVVEFRRKENA